MRKATMLSLLVGVAGCAGPQPEPLAPAETLAEETSLAAAERGWAFAPGNAVRRNRDREVEVTVPDSTSDGIAASGGWFIYAYSEPDVNGAVQRRGFRFRPSQGDRFTFRRFWPDVTYTVTARPYKSEYSIIGEHRDVGSFRSPGCPSGYEKVSRGAGSNGYDCIVPNPGPAPPAPPPPVCSDANKRLSVIEAYHGAGSVRASWTDGNNCVVIYEVVGQRDLVVTVPPGSVTRDTVTHRRYDLCLATGPSGCSPPRDDAWTDGQYTHKHLPNCIAGYIEAPMHDGTLYIRERYWRSGWKQRIHEEYPSIQQCRPD